MTSALLPLALLGAALTLGLALRLVRAAARRAGARAGYFAALETLFDRCETRLQPSGFPRMTGWRGGLAFDLRALPDSLTFRKLPVLWVLVTLPGALPVRATLDIMARPSGGEIFSRFATLPQSLPPLAALPEGVAARSDDAAGVPPAALIARHAALFADPRVKELVIAPAGLRVVLLAEEADRGRYLLFRDAETGMTPVAPARIAPVLDALAALREDLLAASQDKG